MARTSPRLSPCGRARLSAACARVAWTAHLFGALLTAAVAAAPPAYKLSRSSEPDAPSLARAEIPDLSGYTVDAVRAQLPRSHNGDAARLVTIDSLYFLHTSNIIEMDKVWSANGITEPTCVLLSQGSYTLDMVRRQLGDPAVLSKSGDGSYLLSRPIYIAPTGALVVSGGERLKLSTRDGVFVYSNGGFAVVDAEVAAWDPIAGDYSERELPTESEALFYARQSPRPYILGAEGSTIRFANSRIYGLGYKGTSGTFGLSLTPSASGGRLSRYLENRPPPTGWIIGNDIESLFFGYYSNSAQGVVIVGNVFDDNVIYGVDPHDYSNGGIVARNLAQGSKFAHGIIFSRGVRDSWIIENIAAGNAGSGLMLDRDSTDNHLVDNLVLANQGDGIAIYESDRNVMAGNAVLRNMRNGVVVRNSSQIDVQSNELAKNGRSGLEIAAIDISTLETRDFTLDPFRERAHAVVRKNTFADNGRSAIEMRSADELVLRANRYPASGPRYFSGDLEPLASAILQSELAGDARALIEKQRAPDSRADARAVRRTAKEADEDSKATRIVRQHAKRGSPRAMLGLARHYVASSRGAEKRRDVVYWYGRAIAHGRVSAMSELGIYLTTVEEPGTDGHDEGLVLLALAALLDNAKAKTDLGLLTDMLGTSPQALADATRKAAARLKAKRPWNPKVFADIAIRMPAAESAQARRRLARLGGKQARARAASNRKAYLPPRLAGRHRSVYDARVNEKNLKRQKLQERLEAQAKLDAQATGKRRAHLDRRAKRREGARLRVSTFAPGEREDVMRRLEQRLALINLHRAANAQLGLEHVKLPPAMQSVQGNADSLPQ